MSSAQPPISNHRATCSHIRARVDKRISHPARANPGTTAHAWPSLPRRASLPSAAPSAFAWGKGGREGMSGSARWGWRAGQEGPRANDVQTGMYPPNDAIRRAPSVPRATDIRLHPRTAPAACRRRPAGEEQVVLGGAGVAAVRAGPTAPSSLTHQDNRHRVGELTRIDHGRRHGCVGSRRDWGRRLFNAGQRHHGGSARAGHEHRAAAAMLAPSQLVKRRRRAT